MPKSKKTEELDEHEDRDDEEEESDEEESEEEDESDSEEEEDSDEEDSDEEKEDESDEDDSEHLDEEDEEEEDEEDIDAELKRERKGKPDPKRAKQAFKERDGKRKGVGEDEGEDKPISRGELKELLAEERKLRQEQDAIAIAKTLTKSAKKAELIVEKWKNRSFPAHLSLVEQITEMFGAVHAKQLIGQRNEAFRALRNKGRVSKDGSGSHRDGAESKKAPKMSGADESAIKAAGFALKNGRYEKKLPTGTLVWDPKTKKRWFVRNQ